MSNTPLAMNNTPLQVMRQLSDLHRTATTTILNERTPAVRIAYETMCDSLHEAMMGIATGNDPDVEVEGLGDAWLSQARFADGLATVLYERWAEALRSQVLA